jgi:hypothetical protein
VTDYNAVKKALSEGTPPQMLCMTCPWDRNCVNPPAMTSAEIDAQIAAASAKDKAAAAEDPSGQQMPVGTLMTVLAYAGKDTSISACPVLGLRLRSGDGRKLADSVRAQMQAWDDK